MARIDGYNQPSTTTKKDAVFTWTNVYEEDKKPSSLPTSGVCVLFFFHIFICYIQF